MKLKSNYCIYFSKENNLHHVTESRQLFFKFLFTCQLTPSNAKFNKPVMPDGSGQYKKVNKQTWFPTFFIIIDLKLKMCLNDTIIQMKHFLYCSATHVESLQNSH